LEFWSSCWLCYFTASSDINQVCCAYLTPTRVGQQSIYNLESPWHQSSRQIPAYPLAYCLQAFSSAVRNVCHTWQIVVVGRQVR